MANWSLDILVPAAAQTGLGYLSRDEMDAIAVHVPVGAFLLSLTSIVSMLAMMHEKAKAALRGGQTSPSVRGKNIGRPRLAVADHAL